jgi:hypothetical protein
MRKSLILVLGAFGALVLGTVVIAQTHDNAVEKKASDEITFTSDTKVGTQVLKPGRYQVACDTKTVKFSLITVGPGLYTTVTKVLEVPCQGHLGEKRAHTELSLPVKDGVNVLEKLALRGGNVEHVFPGQY